MMEMTFFFLMIGVLNKYLQYPNSSSGISPCSLSFCCWSSLDRSITLIMHVGFPFIFGIWVHFSRQPQVFSFSLKRGCSQSTRPQGGSLLLLSIRRTNLTMGWSKEIVGLCALLRTLVLSVNGWYQGRKWQDLWASLKLLCRGRSSRSRSPWSTKKLSSVIFQTREIPSYNDWEFW